MKEWIPAEVDFESDCIFKILLISTNFTKKKQIVYPLCYPSENERTFLNFGCQILNKVIVNYPKQRYRIMLWDINLEPLFNYMRSTHYNGTKGIVFLFDYDDKYSWNSIQSLYNDIITYTGKVPFVLIGIQNSLIQQRENLIDLSECASWTEKRGGFFIEATIEEQYKVDTAFMSLILKIKTHFDAISSII